MKLPIALALIATIVALVAAQHDSMTDQAKAQNAAKQVALGTFMYSNDFDDKLPSNSKQSGSIYPYVKNLAIFFPFPTDKPAATFKYEYKGSKPTIIKSAFVFNPSLYGNTPPSLKAPAQTVLWSYGPRNHLGFAFAGKTVIAFADGHVKLVTKAEAKKLRWNP